MDAYVQAWTQRQGNPDRLVTDGEGGWNNPWSIEVLKSKGTELKVRAPSQHARVAEVRQSMIRSTMHLMEEDLCLRGPIDAVRDQIIDGLVHNPAVQREEVLAPHVVRANEERQVLTQDAALRPRLLVGAPNKARHRLVRIELLPPVPDSL